MSETPPAEPKNDDSTTRMTKLLRERDGTPIGANVFLTPSQLEALGIDLDTTTDIGYQVLTGGKIHVEQRSYHEDAAAASLQTNLKLGDE